MQWNFVGSKKRVRKNIAKGAAAGALAGAVGAATMIGFATLWHRAFPTPRRTPLMPAPEQDVDALVRSLHAVLGNLSQQQLKVMARAGHILFGAALGAAYGAVAENNRRRPAYRRYADALAFAGSEELLGNELMGWRMGITGRPALYQGTERLHSLVSHLLWAVVTESARHELRAAI